MQNKVLQLQFKLNLANEPYSSHLSLHRLWYILKETKNNNPWFNRDSKIFHAVTLIIIDYMWLQLNWKLPSKNKTNKKTPFRSTLSGNNLKLLSNLCMHLLNSIQHWCLFFSVEIYGWDTQATQPIEKFLTKFTRQHWLMLVLS